MEKTAHHDPAGRRGEVLGGSEGRSGGGGQVLIQFQWRREGFWRPVRGDQKEAVRHLHNSGGGEGASFCFPPFLPSGLPLGMGWDTHTHTHTHTQSNSTFP